MKEITANLWNTSDADAICITTNGFVKKNGWAVMGAGIALEAKQKVPGIESKLGEKIRTNGNNVHIICEYQGKTIVSFPVKHHWKEKAVISLIQKSVWDLILLAEDMKWKKIGLPRPGCGNGGLIWEDVKPLLEPLDDRFYIVDLHKRY
jgi:hypothetical protein